MNILQAKELPTNNTPIYFIGHNNLTEVLFGGYYGEQKDGALIVYIGFGKRLPCKVEAVDAFRTRREAIKEILRRIANAKEFWQSELVKEHRKLA